MKRDAIGLLLAGALLLGAGVMIALPTRAEPSAAKTRPAIAPAGIPPRIRPDQKSQDVIEDRAAKAAGISPVTDAMLLSPPPGDWLQWRRTYDAHGYSPLAEINRGNVGTLRSIWAWTLPAATTQVTPLVHDGILYINGTGGRVQALDATNGELLWEYIRDMPDDTVAKTGRASLHRSFAIYGDKLFLGTDDKHVIALDAKTGELVWDTGFPDSKGWNISAGPLVVKGKVIQGTYECAAGGCPVIALDAETGKELWRFYTVARSGQPGGDSWNGLPDDQRFGASVWTTPSYDPDLNLIFVATGNTYHWQELMKGGAGKKVPGTNRDGLYVDSTIALDATTGKLKWYYQHLPQDYWDLDFAFEQTIATMNVHGKLVKVVCSTGKMVWTDCVEAASGKFVLAHDAGLQNIIKSYDPKTGRKVYNEQAIPDLTGHRWNLQCSAGYGSKNWPAGSYDAATGIDYTSLVEVCGESVPTMFAPNISAYTGSQETRMARYQPGSDGNIGRLDAVNWATGKTIWSVRQRASITSATLATAGDLVFAGDADRWFRAYSKADGKVLWKSRLNDVINAFPITYAVKGKQYVAVVTGCCGNGRLNNMHQLTPEISAASPGGSVLWVFALPDAVPE
jgi:alcohol dehydrogenase (cytochrome c)